VLIVGAGAAGLATAIFTKRLAPGREVVLVDGARRPGAKILVSGGSRCNVTNARVTERDFLGGSRPAIRQILRSLPVDATIAFFAGLGVALHEEDDGKLFPDTNRSRDVLEGLLAEAARLGVDRRDGHRVSSVEREAGSFLVASNRGAMRARRVVLATGGQSPPKSGSDGAGFSMARALGHTIVTPVPALVPLLLDPAASLDHRAVSGVSNHAEIAVWVDGRRTARVRGSLLWTHVGVSGPAALDVSRHYTRAVAEGRHVRLVLAFCPGETFESIDRRLVALAVERPRASVGTLLATVLPASLASALAAAVAVDPARPAGELTREDRRRLAHALAAWPMPVTGTRGYNYAEVTAGGVALSEVNPRTMESRVCPGLFLVGEVLDVDGRLGGFNFQWAWASAATAARALSAA
jgi:predicted Rossmann fold flavoprotein